MHTPNDATENPFWWRIFTGSSHCRCIFLAELLAHGAACCNETKELLPVEPDMRTELVSLFRKYGIDILAGANMCNACCSPE